MTNPSPRPESELLDADNAYFVSVFREMMEIGAGIARRLGERDAADPKSGNGKEYDIVIQSMRRTAALIQKIKEPKPVPAPRPAAPPPPLTRTEARKRLIRDVEDGIRHRAKDPDHENLLRGELNERLDDPEFEHELATRPLEDIIEEIRRDLGIASLINQRMWRRRTPGDIIALRARAAGPLKHHLVGPPTDPDPPPKPS